MPRRSRIRTGALEDLAAQLRFAPRATLLRQIERAEKLVDAIKPTQTYAEDWVAWKITGYRRDIPDPALLVGEALLGDLSAFMERLSEAAKLTLAELGPEVLSIDDLCARWNVSRRSLERYRRIGLVGLRALSAEGSVTLIFRRAKVEAFERAHADRIAAAGRLTHMSAEERATVVRLGRAALSEPATSASKAVAALAPRIGRGRETIRRALLRAADEDPGSARTSGALSARQRMVIWRAHLRGILPSAIASRLNRSRSTIHRVINERRGELLRRLDLSGPASAEFLNPRVAAAVLAAPGVADNLRFPLEPTLAHFIKAWRGAHAIDARHERSLAEAYCLLKFRAARNVESLPRRTPASRDLDRIETDLRWAERLKIILARSQCGLALRTIEERLGPAEHAPDAPRLLTIVMAAALEAIDAFDPFKGGRLAAPTALAMARALGAITPATDSPDHARNPRAATRSGRADQPLPDWANSATEWSAWLAPPLGIEAALERMPADAAAALTRHFGLDGSAPATMLEISERFGLTEARQARWYAKASGLTRRIHASLAPHCPSLRNWAPSAPHR